jgi:hypothetical protein
LEGHSVRIGEIVDILDNDRAGLKRGGRIISVDKSQSIVGVGGHVTVWLDRPIEIRRNLTDDYSSNFQFSVARNFNGGAPGYIDRSSQVYKYNLTLAWYNANGFTSEGEVKKLQKIIFPTDSSYSLSENEENLLGYQLCVSMVWTYSCPELISTKFRILGINESEDGSQFLITASPYDPEKYAIDGQKITLLPNIPTTNLPNQNKLIAPEIIEFSRNRRFISSTNSYEYIDELTASWTMEDSQSLTSIPNVAGFKIYVYKDGVLWKTINAADIGQNFTYSFEFSEYNVTYAIRVAAVYKYSSQESLSSKWSLYIGSNTIDKIPDVRGLYLVNNILDTSSPQDYDEEKSRIFYGQDAIFSWTEANVNVTPEAGELEDGGADTTLEEASKQNYAIRIYDPRYVEESQFINEYYSLTNNWIYNFSNNKNDGLRRNFIVNVAFQNSDGNRGLSESIEVTNEAPSAPSASELVFSYDKLGFNLKYSSTYADRDYVASLLIITPSDIENNLENLFREWESEENIISGLKELIKNNKKASAIFQNNVYISPFSK